MFEAGCGCYVRSCSEYSGLTHGNKGVTHRYAKAPAFPLAFTEVED
jgi:hypothetical protein